MNLRQLRKLALITIFALGAKGAVAQDLLARQAPVDRKMHAIDSIALSRLAASELLDNPAADLYDDWDNHYAHRATALPDSFRIDLSGFCMPTPSRVITSNFGSRWGRQHKGLDIKVYIGDTIRAAFDGKVRVVRYEAAGYGKYVVIRHDNGLETIYGHMSKQLVEEDEIVRAGDPIGLGGNTGRSTGSHLHFETRLCGTALNPAIMFDFRAQDVVADSYMYRRGTYEHDSRIATQLRGVGGNGEDVELASAAPAAKYEAATRYHKVSRGETLSTIARKRGTTIDKLCRLNHIGKSVRLMPGQILKYN